MKIPRLILLLALVIFLFSGRVLGQDTALPRSTPEAQGVSSSGLCEFIETADRQVNSMHARF